MASLPLPPLQGSAKRRSPGLVNFVPTVVNHFCLALPAAFTQPGVHLQPSSVLVHALPRSRGLRPFACREKRCSSNCLVMQSTMNSRSDSIWAEASVQRQFLRQGCSGMHLKHSESTTKGRPTHRSMRIANRHQRRRELKLTS